MRPESTIELCESIALCCSELGSILYTSFPSYDISKGLLENFGCVLGYLCANDGLSLDEAGECIACFVGVNGANKEDFFHIARALEFYCKQILQIKDNDSFLLAGSSICYNLANPKTWNDFNNEMPLAEINGFTMIWVWTQVSDFLFKQVPLRINPILEKL